MAINDFSISQGLGPYESTESRVRDALSTCKSFLAKVPVNGRKEFIRENCPPIPDNFEPTKGEPQAIRDYLKLSGFKIYARENWSEDMWRLHRWLYCRLTEMVDTEIGLVLSALRESSSLRRWQGAP